MRPSSLAGARHLIEGCRAGTVTFDALARAVRPLLDQRAAYFIRAWAWSGQSAEDAEDLVQDMLVSLWRALDNWDPERTRDVVRYVDAQVGRAATRRLRRVAGYPDVRRSTQPARRTVVEDLDAVVGSAPATAELNVIRSSAAAETLSALAGLDLQLAELVLDGRSIEEAADRIYADPDLRIEYRLDSRRDARRIVGAVARRISNGAAAAR